MTDNWLLPFLFPTIAGIFTLLGGLLFFQVKKIHSHALHFSLGLSAGVMIYLSFMELLPHAILDIGFLTANIFFFLGILFMSILDYLMPHSYIASKLCSSGENDRKLFKAGFMITSGLAIHNFPEGIAVFIGTVSDLSLGFLLMVAIALHNIPEGIAVAAPIYYSTKSKMRAFKYVFLTSIMEPIGAVAAFALFAPWLSEQLVAYIFSVVAGIMVYIAFDELLPVCMLNSEKKQIPIIGLLVGMMLMAISLVLF